jgi:hypothetical protein
MKRVHAARSLGSVNYVEVNGADRSAFPRRPNIPTFPDLHLNYVPKQVGFCVNGSYMCMCTWNPPSRHRILIGHSLTARPFVLSPSNIHALPTSHCTFIRARTKSGSVLIFFSHFKNCVSLKVSKFKMNKSESVCKCHKVRKTSEIGSIQATFKPRRYRQEVYEKLQVYFFL